MGVGRARIGLGLTLLASARFAEVEALLEEEAQDRSTAGASQGVRAAMTLELAAARADWSAFDAALTALCEFVDRSGIADHDLGAALERAGAHARAGGEPGRAATAYGVALVQYELLGATEASARVRSGMQRR